MEDSAVIDRDFWKEVDVGRLGMWLFLLSEVMLFGALFASCVMARWGNSLCALGRPVWPSAGYSGSLALPLINTIVLLTSSFTMSRSVAAARDGESQSFKTNLLLTILLGLCFMAIKAIEYRGKFHHGFFPGSPLMQSAPGLTIFVSYYFALTGLHGLHVIGGIVWNFFILRTQNTKGLTEPLARKAEYAGIYWQFVDIIWMFIFPLFYLI